jgi:hypothetical protein
MEYRIETITDIINAVNKDNIDNFLIDFKYYISAKIQLLELEKQGILEDKNEGVFVWLDDGKNNVGVKITTP